MPPDIAGMPLVRAAGLCFDYGPRRVLDDVSFTLERGEVLGLLGPNGAGKSTCLRLVTGFLVPASGTVAIDGHDLARDGTAARRLLGFVPEDATLYPHLTVEETLLCFARLRGLDEPKARAEQERVLSRLALGDMRRRAVGKLSRGYRQRLAIALALQGSPPLLVLDEPTNGLDPWQILELRELIAELAPTHGILVTSHVLAEIERVATRALFLHHGRLLGSRVVRRDDPGALEREFLALTAPVHA
jgi:ABC-2 type transport system ATP-binding protein